MKRKLALLLAVVMALSLLPMNVFGATTVSLSKNSTVVPDGTVLYEEGLVDQGSRLYYRQGGDNAEFYVEGMYYDMAIDGTVRPGDQIFLRLDKAVWFFRETEPPRDLWNDNTTSGGALLNDNTQLFPDVDYDGRPLDGTGGLKRASEITKGRPNDGNDYTLGNPPSHVDLNYRYGYTHGSPGTVWSRWNDATGAPVQSDYRATFDPRYGALVTGHTTAGIVGNNNRVDTSYVTYLRFGDNTRGANKSPEIPYLLRVNEMDSKEAILTILGNGFGPDKSQPYESVVGGSEPSKNHFIRIPMVIKIDGEGDITLTVTDTSVSGMQHGTRIIANSGGGSTVTSVRDPETARDNFVLPQIIIRENRFNTIGDGAFVIKTPVGFEFKGDAAGRPARNKKAIDDKEEIRAYLEGGLSWANISSGQTWRNVNQRYDQNGQPASDSDPNAGVNVSAFFRMIRPNEWDYTTLYVVLNGVRKSSTVPGSLHISGLGFEAMENAKYGDVMFTIEEYEGRVNNAILAGTGPIFSTGGAVTRVDGLDVYRKAGVSRQTFIAGYRKPWDVLLETISDIPTLINGRYYQPDPQFAEDASHRTARVRFSEQAARAWWAERETVFTLPEGVKFRKVFISDRDAVSVGPSKDKNYYPSDTRVDNININGNEMVWRNMMADAANARAKVEMDIWVSIRSDFEGDVTLAVGGSGIPLEGGHPPIPIAYQISPITIDTKITDIKIGYQDQAVADIIITENVAGALERGKNVRLSITDMVSTDMAFSPNMLETVKVETTGGELKIKNVSISGVGTGFDWNPATSTYYNLNNYYTAYASGTALDWWDGGQYGASGNITGQNLGGTIYFEIDRASSEPSTITISNVSVKIDRTVPYTNDRPYKLLAWGSAIAPNYGPARDQFPSRYAGIFVDYLMVVSSPEDVAGVLSNEVWVTDGESFCYVNGVPVDMPAAAYISQASNSFMVPLRFVSNGLGISDDHIIWSDIDRSVTINAPSRTVKFTIGDSTMINNGVPVTMQSLDVPPLPVSPEIMGDRAYVPFRALGNAFGVPVSFDNTSRTAKYNEGKYRG